MFGELPGKYFGTCSFLINSYSTVFISCDVKSKIAFKSFGIVLVAEILKVHSGQAWDLEMFTNKSDLYVIRCIYRTLQTSAIANDTSGLLASLLSYLTQTNT